MGGSVKGIANTVGRVGSGVFTLGGSEIARNNLSQKNVFNQALNAPGTILTGGQSTYANPFNPSPAMQANGAKGSPIYDTTIDPYGDASAVRAIGQQAYDANTSQLQHNMGTFQQDQQNIGNAGAADLAARASSRDQLAQLLQQQAQQSFKMSLPQTAEDYNSGGLLNSSGYGNEVARQQANLASQISNQVAQQGLKDIDVGSQYRQAGLQSQLGANDYYRQGTTADTGALNATNQAALQRQFSVKDFANAANVASIIGAQSAPSVGNGKSGTGALLGGAGTLAKGVGGLKGGPAGAAAAGAVAPGAASALSGLGLFSDVG